MKSLRLTVKYITLWLCCKMNHFRSNNKYFYAHCFLYKDFKKFYSIFSYSSSSSGLSFAGVHPMSMLLSSSSDSGSAESLSNWSLNDDSDFEAMLPSGPKSKRAKWSADVKARIKAQWARYSCLYQDIVINICAILKERF